MLTINSFKQFLIKEIIAKSNASAKDACDQVYEFAKTKGFFTYYEKWKKVHYVHIEPRRGPKHIRDILHGMILEDQCQNVRTR